MRYWKKFVASLASSNMTNLELIKACEDAGLECLHKVNKYSSRQVFALNDKYVIKICRSYAGSMQNWNEINLSQYMNRTQKKYFAKVHELTDDVYGRFIVMERLTVNNRSIARKIYSDNLNAMRKVITETDKAMCLKNISDFAARNCGTDLKGNIKMLDFGGCMKVYELYHAARVARHNNKGVRGVLVAEEDVCVSEF